MIEGLTVGERIVLLALDEESGELREAPLRVALAASAAVLVELRLAGELVERDGSFVVVGVPAETAGAVVAERVRSHAGETAREVLLGVREEVLDAVYRELSGKGLVREEGRRVLGAFGSVRHPVTGTAELAALREELADVVVGGQEPGERTAALVAVLHHAGLRSLLPGGAEAEARVAAIAEGQTTAAALGDTIRATVAALTAVIAASAL
ncbi:GPP34 family phosphoprotein [Streptomyces roseirectus]|uniref:GPP34 family phosphoprotein n=1 Tax=Streptomyces roseirectus TaxID=2768066 RepID=A0A7H0IIQ0_9ACTN|nr:GPP34 family phosphoprotein [Streptomyces roseirectus]QNP72666.1 GPP34 family phosphoprotein [Streptomyces roseirectus]